MGGDTIEQVVTDLTFEELSMAEPNSIWQMLQGQDRADYIALRQAEERKLWLWQRRLTDNDVYGRHTHPRPIEPEEGLGRMLVKPKGLINWGTSEVRDENYVGEHRRPKSTTYPDGMTYLCGRSLFRVDGEYPDELIAWLDDEEADVYGGYVNQ